jgi:hypothetical protein
MGPTVNTPARTDTTSGPRSVASAVGNVCTASFPVIRLARLSMVIGSSSKPQ